MPVTNGHIFDIIGKEAQLALLAGFIFKFAASVLNAFNHKVMK
ncbi:hypothetical protein HMPREF0813_00792 [Streptococcus anginosus F0211]|uniref:Uncharacterized protein n=1 Tax=Streptococcus anginosus F0211 TaxID=706437 RepID=E6J0M1_STRAP|nr:hypothetical protein HMPREF0813_00792 [Streptococcus anginosus F0211]ETS95842.1 hypothetical protein HMPREF1512_1788 [Streptococcus sp. OBRC6]EUC75977.1 hypothetical protein HMPREF1511_0306 [Streptococcus sp. CM7]